MSESPIQKKTSTALEAIVLTLLIHVVVLVIFYFSDIGMFSFGNAESNNQDVEFDFIEITEDLLALSEPETQDNIAALLDKYKNVTSKEGATQNDVVQSYSFNKGKVDDQVREDLLRMEQEEFEKLKKEGVIPKELNQEDLPGEENKSTSKPKEGASNTTNSSYSAATSNYDFSRDHEYKKDPAYKCRLFGQIIVEISVNRNGEVISAKGVSGDLNKQCLVEESEAYALRWKFASKFDAPKSEKGTITFTFLPQ